MASITLGGNPATTNGDLPAVGTTAPDATLLNASLEDVAISSFRGSPVVLNIFPSVDTGVCAASVRTFNERIGEVEGAQVVNISQDLPFAQKRFCGAEGIEHAVTLSGFRSDFAEKYGVLMTSSAFAGLSARAIVVLDAEGTVKHTELVSEIANAPDFDAALAALK